MTDKLIVKRIDPGAEGEWDAIDRLRGELGAPSNPLLFPAHFLKATFPKIGGIALQIEAVDGSLLAGCFLFPRDIQAGHRIYTLRYHRAPAIDRVPIDGATLCQRVEASLGGDRVVFDDPAAKQTYSRTSQMIAGINIGRPDAAEAMAVRELAREIWETDPDGLYPVDIAANEFHPGTALVARIDGAVAGFLLGFYKFGGASLPEHWTAIDDGLCLESQLLGVHPRARQHGLGTLLKQVQAEQAAAAGIGLVNWTVDPLQFGNAVLNFGRLRAIAFDFLPDYYPFRNALNRVPASRLAMTWLVGTARVKAVLAEPKPADVRQLSDFSRVRRVNDGPRAPLLEADDPTIAIEIPAHWTTLQRDNLAVALAWRATTDELFRRYLGPRLGDYMLTDVAADGERRFLIGQRIDAGLIARYGEPARLPARRGATIHAD